MQAWRKHLEHTEPIREEVPIPSTPSNGFLVRILAAGVCHSDYALLQYKENLPGISAEKYTLGHEGCGEIVEVGPDVNDPRFQKGTIIAICAVPGCGLETCIECGPGYPQLCKNEISLGLGADGSFATYVAVPYRAAIPVPKGVSPPEAAVATDACLTAYHAIKRTADVKSSETVILFGLGGLGFNGLQILLAIGARVIAVEKRQDVLDEAIKFGLRKEDAVPPGDDVVEFVNKRKIVVDAVVDFVGVNSTFSASQHLVRAGGRLCQVGLLGPELTIHNSLACRKKISILYSYGGTLEDLGECLELISKGLLKPQVETTSMDNFPDALRKLHEGKIKSRIVLLPAPTPKLA